TDATSYFFPSKEGGMKRFACWAGTAAVVAVSWLLVQSAGAVAKDYTIKEIMTRLHKGANSPLIRVKKSLQVSEPDWDDLQEMTKQFVTLGSGLARNDPPMGEKESWRRLCKAYVDNAGALNAAAEKKDKRAALAAHSRLAASCTACHKAHRE